VKIPHFPACRNAAMPRRATRINLRAAAKFLAWNMTGLRLQTEFARI